ncbi:MAG: hypothetical protein J0G30_08855 [Actinomycetales bacterium]|nr:hypothetical protein [Actinomycetales bacterium]
MRRFGIVLGIVGAAIVVIAGALALLVGFGLVPGTGGESGSSFGSGAGLGEGDSVDGDLGRLDLYEVQPDASLNPQPRGATADAWDVFVRMVGADAAATEIETFAAGDAPDSSTLAYVEEASEPGRWTLAINVASVADDGELLFGTLIHEYAHVLSLAPDEFSSGGGSCPTIDVQEGCAVADSYLWAFYEQFWAGYEDAPPLDNVDEDVAWEFYQAHEEDFVNDYAATNVSEDFAESYTSYVLESSTSTDTVVGRKLAFFDDYPALRELRERIRAEFAGDYGLP